MVRDGAVYEWHRILWKAYGKICHQHSWESTSNYFFEVKTHFNAVHMRIQAISNQMFTEKRKNKYKKTENSYWQKLWEYTFLNLTKQSKKNPSQWERQALFFICCVSIYLQVSKNWWENDCSLIRLLSYWLLHRNRKRFSAKYNRPFELSSL